MKGQLELGALVAFLSAQEKLYEPWKELLDFYQAYQDSTVRYRRTMEYFDAEPDHALLPEGRDPYQLGADIEIKNLTYQTDTGIRLLKGIDLSLKAGESLAIVGFSGSGKSTLALCIGQLYRYTGGHIHIGGHEVGDISNRDIMSVVGIVSQQPFIFEGTIEENLLYSCRAGTDGDRPVCRVYDAQGFRRGENLLRPRGCERLVRRVGPEQSRRDARGERRLRERDARFSGSH